MFLEVHKDSQPTLAWVVGVLGQCGGRTWPEWWALLATVVGTLGQCGGSIKTLFILKGEQCQKLENMMRI